MQNILGNPGAEDAYRIELEFVENLMFSGIFNNKKY